MVKIAGFLLQILCLIWKYAWMLIISVIQVSYDARLSGFLWIICLFHIFLDQRKRIGLTNHHEGLLPHRLDRCKLIPYKSLSLRWRDTISCWRKRNRYYWWVPWCWNFRVSLNVWNFNFQIHLPPNILDKWCLKKYSRKMNWTEMFWNSVVIEKFGNNSWWKWQFQWNFWWFSYFWAINTYKVC